MNDFLTFYLPILGFGVIAAQFFTFSKAEDDDDTEDTDDQDDDQVPSKKQDSNLPF